MKIFLDTEFYEHGNRNHGYITVELISLGAVREDGAEFYAENSEFDWNNVPEDHWLQDNVKPHLLSPQEDRVGWDELKQKGIRCGVDFPQIIAAGFREFAIGKKPRIENADLTAPEPCTECGQSYSYEEPEFWGYFCDYDWVVLCGLYGRMNDLPPEFPMYCRDLKQEMDRIDVSGMNLPDQPENQHHALADARWIRDAYILTRVWGTEDF